MRAMVVTGPSRGDWRAALRPEGPGSLAAYQAVVGGLIEALPIDKAKASVFANDSGRMDGMPVTAMLYDPNECWAMSVCGPLVILGPVDEEGETLPLTTEALLYVMRRLVPWDEVHPDVQAALAAHGRVIEPELYMQMLGEDRDPYP